MGGTQRHLSNRIPKENKDMKHILQPEITIIGSGKPVVGIVGAMHGNESGSAIIKRLQKTITLQKGTIIYIIANPEAHKKNIRYVDSDLNRSFPGNIDGNREERLASQLVEIGKNFDYLMDLHSCSMESEPFCIVRTTKGKDMQLAKKTGLPHIVIYPRSTQGGGSLIDYVSCGIGLELGLHDKESTVRDGYTAVVRVLYSLDMITNVTAHTLKQSSYLVTGHIPRTQGSKAISTIINFSLIKKGEPITQTGKRYRRAKEDMYPILYGESSYKTAYGWIGKKIVEI